MTVTVHSAGIEDIWPGGTCPHDARTVEEIRSEALRVTDDDIRGMRYSPWYSKILVGEHRVLARRQLAKSLEGQRIAELEHTIAGQAKRIAELEGIVRDVAKMLAQDGKCLTALGAPPVGLNYGGVWSPERDYPSLVTDKGALHVATEMTIKGERPGSGGPWQERVNGHLSVPDDDRPKTPPCPRCGRKTCSTPTLRASCGSPAHGARSMPWQRP